MIAKVPTKRRDGRSSFGSLIAYIAESAHKLVCGEAIWSARTAASEMRHVASANKRCKDPVYHYVLSWPAPEQPSDEQAGDAIRTTLAELGLTDHQWVAAIHRNTSHAHVHVAVNRVHPTTFRVAVPRRDWLTLDRACRSLELKHGWAHDRGPYGVTTDRGTAEITRAQPEHSKSPARPSSNARDFSAWTGLESFQTWIAGEPARQLQRSLLSSERSWQRVHEALSVYNLEYRLKGSGAVVVDHNAPDKLCAKASHLGRFASRSRLEAILGPYQAALRSHSPGLSVSAHRDISVPPDKSYRRVINQPALEKTLRRYQVDPLYDRYRTQLAQWKASGLPGYRSSWELQRQRERNHREELRRVNREARGAICLVESPQARRLLYSYQAWVSTLRRHELCVQSAAQREGLRARGEHDRPGRWSEWLLRQADAGDERARQRLRRLRLRERRWTNDPESKEIGTLCAASTPRLARLDGYRVVARHDGLDYCVNGRVAFRDAGHRVAVYDVSEQASLAGLLLAREKWGPNLTIAGSQGFEDSAHVIASKIGVRLQPSATLNRSKADLSPRLIRNIGVIFSDFDRLVQRLGKPLSGCEPQPGRSYVGRILAIAPASNSERVIVLDLGRRLGAFRVTSVELSLCQARVGDRVMAAAGELSPTHPIPAWRLRGLERTRTGPDLGL